VEWKDSEIVNAEKKKQNKERVNAALISRSSVVASELGIFNRLLKIYFPYYLYYIKLP